MYIGANLFAKYIFVLFRLRYRFCASISVSPVEVGVASRELNGVGALVKETRRDAWHELSSRFVTRRGGKTCTRLGRLIRYSRRPAIDTMAIISAPNTRAHAHAVVKRACSRSWGIYSRTRRPLSLNSLHNFWNHRGIVAWRRLCATRTTARAAACIGFYR